MANPHLLITIDTELSNFRDSQGLWGRVGQDDWGLSRMLEVFREFGIPATFFLDVYGGSAKDIADQQRAAELIAQYGQDLQLHTHPGPAFDPARERLRDYTLQEQEDIIAFGNDRIQKWSGQRPVLHRAGDWGADNVSIQALQRQGMRADFSASAWSPNCGYDREVVSQNGWTRVDGLLCGVGTCYRDGLTGRMRRVDLGGASFAEGKAILSLRADPMFLTLHSFSLMTYNQTRTRFFANPGYIKALKAFFELARDRYGYRPLTALQAVAELETTPDARLPRAELPKTGIVASSIGIAKSIRGRIAEKLA